MTGGYAFSCELKTTAPTADIKRHGRRCAGLLPDPVLRRKEKMDGSENGTVAKISRTAQGVIHVDRSYDSGRF